MISIKKIVELSEHTDLVDSLEFIRSKRILTSAGRDGNLFCWDTVSYKTIFSWCPYEGFELYHATTSYDGRFTLACFSQYKEAHVVDRMSNRSVFVPLLEHCTFPLFGPDNSILSYSKNIIYKIDVFGHDGIDIIFRADSKIDTFQLSTSKTIIVCTTRKNTVYIIDALTGRLKTILPKLYTKIAFISISDNGSLVAVGDKHADCIDVWHIDINSHSPQIRTTTYSNVQSWCDSVFRCGHFNLINSKSAFICSVLTPLIYIDCSLQKSQLLDKEIGYVENIAVDKYRKIIYMPLASKSLGTLGVISYTYAQGCTCSIE